MDVGSVLLQGRLSLLAARARGEPLSVGNGSFDANSSAFFTLHTPHVHVCVYRFSYEIPNHLLRLCRNPREVIPSKVHERFMS